MMVDSDLMGTASECINDLRVLWTAHEAIARYLLR